MSGIIESSPSTVANAAPRRIPRYAGMKRSRMPTTAMRIVVTAIGVEIGVTVLIGPHPNRSLR